MINPDPNGAGGTPCRSSSDIESDIRRTRGRMDATLDELGSRLTARSVIHTLLDIWEAKHPETAQGEARTKTVYTALSNQISHQIKENPVPSLLVGAGLVWALLDRHREHDDREYVELGNRRYRVRPSHSSGPVGAMSGTPVTEYEYEPVEYEEIHHGPSMIDRAKERLQHGKDAISDAASAAKERLTGIKDSARDRVAGAGETVRDQASTLGSATRDQVSGIGDVAHDAAEATRLRARQAYERGRYASRQVGESVRSGYDTGVHQFTAAVNEYPLLVGLGFAALGAAFGALMPHTRKEDELLGERSDELLDVVKDKTRDTIERGKVVAERVAETALDEAQKQGFTAEAAGQKLTEIASKVGDVARKVKEEAKVAAEEQNLVPSQLKSESSASTSSGFTADPLGGDIPEGDLSTIPVVTTSSTGTSMTMPPKGVSTSNEL